MVSKGEKRMSYSWRTVWLVLTIFVGIFSDALQGLKGSHKISKVQLFSHLSLELLCKKSHVQVVYNISFNSKLKIFRVLFYNFRMFKQGKPLVALSETVPWEFQIAPCQSKLSKILQIEEV